MGENDGERSALINKFYQIYRPIQKSHGLRCVICTLTYTAITLLKSGSMWERGAGAVSAKVKEEDEIACYKRAIEILISYSGKGDHAKV